MMIMILICLIVLHLGATKMHMIQTGWQKNLHTSFLTKHSLLNSRYRSSVKIISVTLVVWWTIQWLILVHTWLYMSVSHLFNFSLWVIFLTRYMYTCLQRSELLPCVPLFCLVPHFDIVCELLLNWCDSTMESINFVNNIHEKLLDSDWLRAVQYKCNTPVQKV